MDFDIDSADALAKLDVLKEKLARMVFDIALPVLMTDKDSDFAVKYKEHLWAAVHTHMEFAAGVGIKLVLLVLNVAQASALRTFKSYHNASEEAAKAMLKDITDAQEFIEEVEKGVSHIAKRTIKGLGDEYGL
jgi:hypothetical protein